MAKPKAQTLQQRFGFQDKDLKTPKHDEMILWLHENMVDFLAENSLWVRPKYNMGEIETVKSDIIRGVKKVSQDIDTRIEKCKEDTIKYQSFVDEKSNDGYYRTAVKSEKSRLEDLQEKEDFLESASVRFEPLPELLLASDLLKIVWETPVMSGKFIMGFIDMIVRAPTKYSYNFSNFDRHHPKISIENYPPDLLEWKIQYKERWNRREEFLGRVDFNIEVKTSIPSMGELVRQIRMYQPYTTGKWIVVCPDDRFREPLASQGITLIKYTGGVSQKRLL